MNRPRESPLLAGLESALAGSVRAAHASARLAALIDAGAAVLPLPGSGETLLRWQALERVARDDLSLAKLYEGHTDALAILAELDAAPAPRASTWGVWAAEGPQGKAVITDDRGGGRVVLNGGKCWCSGAGSVTHALLTAWTPDGDGPQLVRIDLRQPGIRVSGAGWHAVGMQQSASVDVVFEDVAGERVGGIGDYLSRPGFWQGGAGIAACWHGGAVAIAEVLRGSLVDAELARRSELRRVALGKVDVALRSTVAVLSEVAAWIDANPVDDARGVALRVRLLAEETARRVLDEVGRALGAGPFCRDERFARMAADLPVFVRQSHAERDHAALGDVVLATTDPWTLSRSGL